MKGWFGGVCRPSGEEGRRGRELFPSDKSLIILVSYRLLKKNYFSAFLILSILQTSFARNFLYNSVN